MRMQHLEMPEEFPEYVRGGAPGRPQVGIPLGLYALCLPGGCKWLLVADLWTMFTSGNNFLIQDKSELGLDNRRGAQRMR